MAARPILAEKGIIDTVNLPVLPVVAAEALAIIDKANSTVDDLEAVIAQDQVIAARVLRLANSAYFAQTRGIGSISEAVSLIGFDMVRALIIGAAMRDLNRIFGHVEKTLWEHSVGVSLAASLIAGETGHAPPDLALISGLLHDIGTTAINNSLPESQMEVLRKGTEQHMDVIAAEKEVLGFTHCDVGGIIARAWNLPAHIEAAIRFHHMHGARDSDGHENVALSMLFFVLHHADEGEGSTLHGETDHLPLCEVVSLADQMCHFLGIGFTKLPGISRELLDRAGMGEDRFLELSELVNAGFREHASRFSADP